MVLESALDLRAAHTSLELAPDTAAHVPKELDRRVRRLAVERLLLDEPRDPGRAQERAQHALLIRPDAIEHADRFDPPQDFGLDRPRGHLKRRLVEELHRRGLALARHGLKQHTLLADVLLLRVEAADDLRDVRQLGRPLAEHAAVQLAEIVVRLAGLRGRCRQQYQL